MTEWKPGNVAQSSYGRVFRAQKGWIFDDESGYTEPEAISGFRPLVVIDPEDREQVERLVAAYCDAHNVPSDAPIRETGIGYMQAALREFAAPTPRVCDAILTLGNLRIECERDPGHVTDHRNDSVGQGVRWGA